MADTSGVREGMPVLDSDNQRLGTVEAVDDDGIRVAGQEVPLGAVARVHNGHVHLKGSGSLYMLGGTAAGSGATGYAGRIDATYGSAATDETVELRVAGGREDVAVRERDIADRPAQEGAGVFQEGSFREGEIRLPLHEEETVVTGERRAVEAWARARGGFEQRFATRTVSGGRGRTFAEAEPNYRAGFDAGFDERYAGREWDVVEPDLRGSYRAPEGGLAFDEVRDEYYEGFTGARSAGTADLGTTAPLTTGTATGDDRVVIPIVEERVDVTTRPTELGEVQVRRTVVEERVEVPVDLMREEVRIERRDIADRPISAADAERLFEGGTIRVPVRGEEAVVTKEAVVTGEVVIDKEQTTERQTVSDTVRKTRVSVDEDYARALPAFQQHFAARAGTGVVRSFEEAEPHYRRGFEAATDERYAGRAFEEAEPELRQSYASSGDADADQWAHLREEVREGYTRARSGS